MFRGEYGICTTCKEVAEELGIKPQKKWIVVKKPYLCKYHNDIRKSGGTVKIKPITKSSIKPKFRKATGEWEMFTTIWRERKHICTGCGKSLGDNMIPHYFSHILPKSRFPELRLDPNNIMIECVKCHSDYETKGIEVIRKKRNFQAKLDYIKGKDYLKYCKFKGI